MNLVLTAPPTIEPISLDEAKELLKVDTTDDDVLIHALISTARDYCEGFQNRAYITQTWQLSFDHWPSRVIDLPKGRLQTINRVTYKNSEGVERTLTENTDYVYSIRGILGRLTPAYGKTWPSFVPFPLDAIVIEFTCGYGDMATSVPANVIHAMRLLMGHWYENREAALNGSVSQEIEFSVRSLLTLNRVMPV